MTEPYIVPAHRFEYFVSCVLTRLGLSHEEIYPLLSKSESIQKNIHRVLSYLGMSTLQSKALLSAMLQQSFHEQERYLKKIPFTPMPYPTVKKHVYEDGIAPLVGHFFSWDDCKIYGLDTETLYNSEEEFPGQDVKTDTIQIYGNGVELYLEKFPVGGQFVEHLFQAHPELFDHNKHVVFFSHNLSFDASAVFGDHTYDMTQEQDPKVRRCNLGVMSFIIYKLRKGQQVLFIDTGNFFMGSLKKLAASHFPHLPKLTPPPFLGIRPPKNEAEYEELKNYAMRDGELHYLLGKEIVKEQKDLGLGVSYTPASMSAKEFRTKFLQKRIFYPPKEKAEFLFKAKYGAVNMALCRGFDTQSLHHCLDVKGLYTYTMQECVLPFSCTARRGYRAMRKGDLFKLHSEVVGWAKVRFTFPDHIVVPSLCQRLDKLYFSRKGETIASTYEIRLALELGARIDFIEGWCWDVKEDDIDHDLKEYVSHLTKEKDQLDVLRKGNIPEHEKQRLNIRRHFVKLRGNSIYGKFLEVNNNTAGVLFHPGIASLILGFSKAYVIESIFYCAARMEVAYTDTDSIIIRNPIVPDARLQSICGDVTGAWEDETPNGAYPYMVRSKVYTLIDAKTYRSKKIGHHSIRFKNPLVECSHHEQPVALHTDHYVDGVFVCPECFAQYPAPAHYRPTSQNKDSFTAQLLHKRGQRVEYTAQHFVKVREAHIRKLSPNKVIQQKMAFDILEDSKRVFTTQLHTMEDLRANWVRSSPPDEVRSVVGEGLTDEEWGELWDLQMLEYNPFIVRLGNEFGVELTPPKAGRNPFKSLR